MSESNCKTSEKKKTSEPSSVRGEWSNNNESIYGGLEKGQQGATATIGIKKELFNNNGHSLEAHTQVSKTLTSKGPTAISGGVDYQGPKTGAGISAVHAKGYGTNVGAHANTNLWRSDNGHSSLDANVNYNRQFGSPFGKTKPNYGGGIHFGHKF